jgi:hypothetical protein
MGPRFVRYISLLTADPVVMRSMRWGIAGAATFLGGTIIGVTLDGLAIGITLAGFLVLTPLLVFAGLLYNFRSDSQSVLPSFKTLLIIMLVCWTSVEVFALGAFAFAWSGVARVAFLLISSAAVAFLIFSQFVKPREHARVPALDEGLISHEP